tara:strand:- start:134 stop:403 length:270 start_codon:yes stop_codon:yes gene_type:complete
MLREGINKILTEYKTAYNEDVVGHLLASFIRSDFPKIVKGLIEYPERYKIEGSAGQGNWARCPWIAIFDVLITTTAQSGYYPAIFSGRI